MTVADATNSSWQNIYRELAFAVSELESIKRASEDERTRHRVSEVAYKLISTMRVVKSAALRSK